MIRTALALIVLAPLSLAVPSSNSASEEGIGSPGTRDYVYTSLDGGSVVTRGSRESPAIISSGFGGSAPTDEEFRRAPAWLCGIDTVLRTDVRVDITCASGDVNRPLPTNVTCQPGERAVDPLFSRVQNATGGWSAWSPVDQGGCVIDVDIRAAIAQELQRLPLTPSALSVQPPSGWTLVNADTVAFADGAEQTLTTTVLGLPVAIRATPTSFSWDFGDGSAPLTTRDPGRPWPEHTIAHRYTAEDTHRISLTTTWSAVFQIAGTPGWEPVTGTATTTSTSAPIEVHEARSHLVAGGTA